MANGEGYQDTRKEMERAIRRLNALEYLILGFVVLLALGGGAVVALVVSAGTEFSFRLTWAALSLLLLIVPGLLVFGREHLKSRGTAREDGRTGNERNPQESGR